MVAGYVLAGGYNILCIIIMLLLRSLLSLSESKFNMVVTLLVQEYLLKQNLLQISGYFVVCLCLKWCKGPK